MRRSAKLIMAAAVACALIAPGLAHAGPVTFTIDSAATSLTITGNALSGLITLIAQSPGSNTDHLTGTVSATEGVGTIQITGATGNGVLQALPQQPLSGGALGSAPADMGLGLGGIGAGVAAVRGLVAGATSPVLTVVGGSFPANTSTIAITTGLLDLNITSPLTTATQANIGGNSALNGAPTGTLVTGGGIETLTLPVAETVTFNLNGIAGNVFLSGQIVATRSIPEPGSVVLLGIALAAMVPFGVRRFRNRG